MPGETTARGHGSNSDQRSEFVAIHGLLDDQLRAVISVLRSQLADNGLAASLGFNAHLSLAICPRSSVAEIEAALASLQPIDPVTIRLTHFGVFGRPVGVLFFGLAPSTGLLALHRSVHQQLKSAGVPRSEWYLPDLWTPHCTIAMPLPPSKVSEALSLVRDATLPLEGTVDSLEIRAISTGRLLALESNPVAARRTIDLRVRESERLIEQEVSGRPG